MAPTKRKTKHRREKTKVGEEVLDLVISYIHNVEDRNSVSLVSRKFYEIDGIMRKRLTVHTHYYPDPSRLSKRFPFMETLTLKGPPSVLILRYHHDNNRLTPWIEQLALGFRYLKELHIHSLVVNDKDLETLARSRDNISYNQLRTLCLKDSGCIKEKDGIWLHQLALNSTVLEKLHVTDTDISDAEDLTVIAKNCCNSLISLKIGNCYLGKLGDAFRYASSLEHFGGYLCDTESELFGFRFPPNMRSLSITDLPLTRYLTILPFLNHIRKLKLESDLDDEDLDDECQCLLFKRCPNLEVLYTKDVCGDRGLQVIGKFCKKLRKLTHNGLVTHLGLIALAKRCTKLECLKVILRDISNEALECVGTHLKNLRDFRIWLGKRGCISDLPLDNGVRAMLMGCNKLERLDMSLWHEGLTDVSLEYIGKYGANLRSLSLSYIGASNTGLVKLSEGCRKLRKLNLRGCPFIEEFVTGFVFNMPSLRYVWFDGYDCTALSLTHPEFQL